jgi:hypothetical protein
VTGASLIMAEAGHGFAHDWQPAGHVTAAGVGATPDVFAPAGQGLAQDSQPAGQVTTVAQSTGAACEGDGVTSWAATKEERREMLKMSCVVEAGMVMLVVVLVVEEILVLSGCSVAVDCLLWL